MNSEKQNDTGRLIAKELRHLYLSDVNIHKWMVPFFLFIASFILLILGYVIFRFLFHPAGIDDGYLPLALLSPIVVSACIIMIKLAKFTSIRRCRIRIYENGFVARYRTKELKPIFIYWNQCVDAWKTVYFKNESKWNYQFENKKAEKFYFSYLYFPINKREIILELLEKRRVKIITKK